MSTQRFLLYLESEQARFTLRCDGENWVQIYPSLLEALQGARRLADDMDTRLTVFDPSGRPIIETFV